MAGRLAIPGGWIGQAFAVWRLSAPFEALLAERGRWPLWLPLLLGNGVSLYFALPSEPAPWLGAACFLPLAGAAWFVRRSYPAMLAVVALATVALGFTAAQGRAARVAAAVLERPSGAVVVGGLAEDVEVLAGGSQRVTLVESWIEGGAAPPRVRIRLKPDAPAVAVGSRIAVRALLTPPPQPAMPGAFDFARHAWFQGLGAVGHALGQPQFQPHSDDPDLSERLFLSLNGLRQDLTARIVAILPGPEGGVAAALITGEQAGIAQPVIEAYRDSGLAHLLSISGLHMTMVAGLVFFVVRGGLALVPAIALRHPIKKWAAAVALVATFFYMLMAGSPVPAQRSFLMTGIVLVAVLLDRQAISMRLVAWAAVAVLMVAPEALVGPSFQMSFAAVVALIAAYEVMAPRLAALKSEHRGVAAGIALYLGGVVFSTLVAGTATAVYGIYHFNRFAVFSVIANMLAVPITGFVVMPFAVVAMVLMPFGLDQFALIPMGWGVGAVNWVAAEVASWPGAAISLPVLPPWGLVAFTLGGAWLCLWRTRWRLWGVVAMVAGLSGMAFDNPPDILVDGRGQGFALRNADGSLLIQKGGRILRETWTRRAGPAADERWPKRGRSNDGRLTCDELGCVWRVDGRMVALVREDDGIAAACDRSDIVIAAVPIRNGCRGARVVVDRFDLWRRGGHALWLTPSGARIETVAEWQGDRPWSHKPVRRKKKVVEEEVREEEKSMHHRDTENTED